MTVSETQPPLLRIAALTKRFGGFTALDNVSVDIRQGERFGLIGPNGSGKTTLINCISGAFRTEPGTVRFRDEDITALPPHTRTRRGIARSFQIPRPFRSMTVAENLMVALDFAAHDIVSSANRRDTMMSILARMGLESKANVPATKVSQVELRKMELARAMATPRSTMASGDNFARSCAVPSIVSRIDPRCGRTRPATHFISVLLPLPLVPSSATVSPDSTLSETPRSALTAP